MNVNETILAMNEKQVSELLGVSVQTLRNWRHLRKGPDYIKMGRAVRYHMDDLQTYIDEKRVNLERIG